MEALGTAVAATCKSASAPKETDDIQLRFSPLFDSTRFRSYAVRDQLPPVA
jgi:hypothetical protein